MKGYRNCKVCGKKYEYCHTDRHYVFRWQDVACSPEHGAVYLAKINRSRGDDTEEDRRILAEFESADADDAVVNETETYDDDVFFDDEEDVDDEEDADDEDELWEAE